jgi:hypothetical protein
MVEPWHETMWRMYSHYQNQLLPIAGGILDQSNFFLEAMELIGSRIAKHHKAKTKK